MSASAVSRLKPLLTPPTSKHTASLIFLHGSGDTGDGVRSWLKIVNGGNFISFPHIRVIYPTAPMRPYTVNSGLPCSVWFDREKISPFCAENVDSIDLISSDINALVEGEVKKGIPRNRIVIGGFSMGGAMSLYYGLRDGGDLKGIFALSSFLNENSIVYDAIKTRTSPIPPIFMCHGARDPLVDIAWGSSTYKNLKGLGVSCQFHTYDNLFHELGKAEVKKLIEWINEILPENI